MVALVGAVAPARAQESATTEPAEEEEFAPVPASAAPTEEVLVPSAFQRAARSVLFPAWGQLTNGKRKKAAILFAVETYLVTGIVIETRRGKEQERLARSLTNAGEIYTAETAAADHFSRRRNLVFWGIVAAFYGVLDAYIDAHLGDFDRELEEGRGLFVDLEPEEAAIQVGLRF